MHNFSDEQVEAAAKAIREVDARAALIADVDLAEYRARAALVAAQGAAPQAPPNLRRIISEALREAYSWSEGTQAVYDVIFPLFTVPVLPSSGVDEEKLAEVIGEAGYITGDSSRGQRREAREKSSTA